MSYVWSLLLLFVLSVSPTMAGDGPVTHSRDDHHHHHHEYADIHDREITSLSEGELEDLRAGGGMGFALPAELNGYPGPSHVLDLADELELTKEQLEQTRRLFEAMREEAIAAGEAYRHDQTRRPGASDNHS